MTLLFLIPNQQIIHTRPWRMVSFVKKKKKEETSEFAEATKEDVQSCITWDCLVHWKSGRTGQTGGTSAPPVESRNGRTPSPKGLTKDKENNLH